MKKWLKRTLVLLCAIMLIACTGVALTSCNKKKKGHTHEWDSGTVTVEATCSEDGEKLFKCTGCDETKTETIEAAHTWKDEVTAPTCSERGYTTRVCEKCGEKRKDTYVDAKGHTYAKTTHDATCDLDGYAEYECADCGDNYTETTAKATGHNTLNATWTVQDEDEQISGCRYERTEVATCATCNENVRKTYEIEKHSYSVAVTTPSTCSTAGVKTYTCKCGDSYTMDYAIVETAHDWGRGTTTDGVTTYTCSHNSAHTKTEIDLTAMTTEDEPTVTVPSEDIPSGTELKMNNATMKIDDTVKGKLTGNVELTAGKYDQDDETVSAAVGKLSDADKERLGDASIFNFGLQSNGQDVDFGGGKITVSVPYVLQEGEDPESIVIAWIKDDGTIELIPATYANGFATFEAEHFSLYTVVRMTAAERCAKYGCKEVSKTIAATCEEDGYTLTTCKICHKTTRSSFTQATGHDYEEQVIAPTCKEQGYTVRTCKNCSDSYTTNYVAKTAHEYESTVVAPTCRAEGYTKFVCKSCRNTEYDSYTDKIAHAYQEGACTMCGAKDPSAVEEEDVNFYLNMVQSVLDADMSLYMEVKDINVDITIPDVLLDGWAQRKYKSQTYNVKLNAIKMFYALDENGNIIAKGEMAMTMNGKFEGEESEDDYLYETEGVIKFVIKDGGLYAYMKSSQIEDGESENYESYAYQPIDMGEMPSLEEIKELLAPVSAKAKIIIDKIYGIKNNPLDSVLAKMTEYVFDKKATEDGYTFTLNYNRFAEVYEALTTKTIAELYDSICGKNAFDKTVTYLKSAVNKTVKGILSDFAKESVKAGISIDDLYAMVDAALVLVPTENNQPMTVQQFLTAYGDLTVKDILDGIVPSGDEATDYAAMIDQVGAALKQMTLVDAIGMIGGGSSGEIKGGLYLSETDQETAQKPSDPIKTLLENVAKMLKTTTMGFTTDKLGNVLSLDLNLDVKNFVYDVATLVGFDKDSMAAVQVDTTELKINATGTAKVTFGGTLDTDYDEIIEKLDGTKKNLTSIDGNIGKDEYGDEYIVKTVGEKVYFVPVFNDESVKAELREYFKNKDQNRSRLSFIEEETVDGKQTSKFSYEVYDGVYRLDKSKNFAFECRSDCKGWERYLLSNLDYTYGTSYYVWYDESTQTIVKYEWAIDETEESFSKDNKSFFGLYYNLNTKKVQQTSPHKWVMKEFVYATCEKEGYTKYRCNVCGEVKVYYNFVSHETYNVYTLKEGSTTCEDGVLVKEHCVLCDKDVNTYETESHELNSKRDTIATSKCGEVEFYWSECACRKEKYEGACFLEKGTDSDYHMRWYNVIDGACDFEYLSTIDSESEEQNGKEDYGKFLYVCMVSNCRFSYTLEKWEEDNGDCTARSMTKYTAGVDEQGNALPDAKTMTFEKTVSNHTWGSRDGKDETKDLEISESYCLKCNKSENKYGKKFDEYGRRIRYWHYNIGLGYIREFNGCNYEEYAMNADGSKGEWQQSGTEHVWYWPSSSGSCSQYGVSGKICRLCGKQELDFKVAPLGHYFVSCADGLYQCVRCGTYSLNNANGNFYFEDMSNGDNYMLGFYNSFDVDFDVTIELNYTVTDDGVNSVVLDGVEYDALYYTGNDWKSVVCGTLAIDITSYNEKLEAYKESNPDFVFESVSIVFTYLDKDSGTYLSEAYTFGLYESNSQSNVDYAA